MEQDDSQAPPAGKIGISYFLFGSIRYIPLVAVCFFVGFANTALEVGILPDDYSSTGALYFRPGVRGGISPESVFGSGSRNVSGREDLQNEILLLNSPELYRKAVAITGAEEVLASEATPPTRGVKGLLYKASRWIDDQFRQPSESASVSVSDEVKLETASILLSQRSNVTARPRTTIIYLTTTAETPEKAQRLTNALLDAAIELHTEVNGAMGSLSKVENELGQLDAAATKAEERRSRFLATNTIFNFASERSSLTSYAEEMQQQADQIELEIEQLRVEIGMLEARSKSMPKEIPASGTGGYVLNPQVATLKGVLEQLQLRRADLRSENARLTISASEVRDRTKKLDTLESDVQTRLAAEPAKIELPAVLEENPSLRTVREELASRRVMLGGLERKLEVQEQQLAKARKRLVKFSDLESEWIALETEATRARASHTRLLESVTSMRAVRRLEQQKLSNLQIMQSASYNPLCIGPQRTKMTLKGALMGGAVGLGLAFALVFLSSRVMGRGDLVRGGVSSDRAFVESRLKPHDTAWVKGVLPSPVESAASYVAAVVKSVQYDRKSDAPLAIAALPVDVHADASRHAAALALGLSTVRGETVTYVNCTPRQSWLEERLGLEVPSGWTDVLSGSASLEDAIIATDVQHLSVLGAGSLLSRYNSDINSAAMRELLSQVAAKAKFVIIELPSQDDVPAIAAVFAAVDGVQAVARIKKSSRSRVQLLLEQVEDAGAELSGVWLQRRRD